MIYARQHVIQTTGPFDKNYRVYISYLRFFERTNGPTSNSLRMYGPKFQS
ncbi:hypothetical protein JG688_00014975 [Phytophthora aleatoria]|uniref:Uncharacterized protein n=1 Tax=Phytophthora aleatoria TaxID=2496075 RepID=A0A8J5MDN6_9STRA|nr:hypothetical protein JG688_00014975 [Phytophthora aleatoria]